MIFEIYNVNLFGIRVLAMDDRYVWFCNVLP